MTSSLQWLQQLKRLQHSIKKFRGNVLEYKKKFIRQFEF